MGLEKINDFKKQVGITNETLAELSGVPKSTIDKITSGTTSDPRLETIKSIMRALGKTLKDLDDPISQGKKEPNAPCWEHSVSKEVATLFELIQDVSKEEAIKIHEYIQFVKMRRTQ